MLFGVMFVGVALLVAVVFAAVFGLIIYRVVRSARDPEYRSLLQARSRSSARRSSAGPSYDPAMDPGIRRARCSPAAPVTRSDISGIGSDSSLSRDRVSPLQPGRPADHQPHAGDHRSTTEPISARTFGGSCE